MKTIRPVEPSWFRPEWRLGRKSFSAYLICGLIGFVLAAGTALALIMRLDLSPLIMASVVAIAVMTFWAVALVTNVFSGREQLVYYHHEIAVMCSSGFFLALLGQPHWPYLDVTQLGIGVFLAWGRLGCLIVGCCHGRPWRWGLTYGPAHVRHGFTPYYLNIPLFPVQALELLWVAAVVLVGAGYVVGGHPPGTAFAWYVIAYGMGRFVFEFFRGDPLRPYYLGFSEAQWISASMMTLVTALEFAGALPLAIWHPVVTTCLIVSAGALYFRWHREGADRHRLLSPPHIGEIFQALKKNASTGVANNRRSWNHPVRLNPAQTSLGLRISVGLFSMQTGRGYLVTISSRSGRLTTRAARDLSRLIAQLKHWPPPDRVLSARPGVFHFIFEPSLLDKLNQP